MKLIHLSDLHIGKRVNGFSMLEDQKYILSEIIRIIRDENPQGILIAGDIYDKAVPPAEAVELFDDFLVRLSKMEAHLFIISGNHDSSERLAFGSRIMKQGGVYFSPVYDGQVSPVSLKDEFGQVDIFMLPFLKPAHVKRAFPEAEVESYTQAIETAVENMAIDPKGRNVLITHQFVTGARRCESEELSVGGSDNVDVSVFSAFDYVALGHLHGPQTVGKDTVRYCGTPLKYSFSEINHQKSITVVELREKGDLSVRQIPLTPKRDLREIRGSYMELTAKSFYDSLNTDDYFHVTLTDEEDIPDAIGKLRVIYPCIMKLDYDNQRTRGNSRILETERIENKPPSELFADFYLLQNNREMSEDQQQLVNGMIETIWEGEK